MFDVRKIQVGSKAHWFLTQNGVDVPYSSEDPSRKPAWRLKRTAQAVAQSLNNGETTLEALQASRFGEKRDPAESAEAQQIASIIKSQIIHTELWAIGAEKLTALARTQDRLGGLQFQVSLFGRHRSMIRIELDASDTYRVLLLTLQGNILRQLDMVFADMLTDTVVTFAEEHFAAKEG